MASTPCCEYIHKMRKITVVKTKQGAYKEHIRHFHSFKKTDTFTYEIINGEKCYNGAGGGFCEEDYINPVKLLMEGKIYEIGGAKTKEVEVKKEVDPVIDDEDCFSISDVSDIDGIEF